MTKMQCFLITLLLATSAMAAPAKPATEPDSEGFASKSDVPVEQLEKLKMDAEKDKEPVASEHVEYHSLDAVKANGHLLSRLEEQVTADAAPGEKPHVHAHLQYDVPSEGVHKEVEHDGEKLTVHDGTAATTASSNDEQTTKVFHGAARLVQAGSGSNNPQGAHTAARRSFNADITKETKNNMDHYSSYAGVQYSPLDMAEYVFWTGDERGVTTAIEEFLQEGLMTKEEAISFLQEIKFNIDFLKAHYAQKLRAAEENAQQEKIRNMLMEQSNAKEAYQYRVPLRLQSFPFANSPDIIHSIANKNWEQGNSLSPSLPMLPVTTDFRSEPVKRSYTDPMLQTNIISTSDYDRDGPMFTEEEYEEMMEKLKAADTLYTEYTLEEIIYQLAKMMFSQTLSHDPREARAIIQRFMTFLELEAERGQLSRSIEKKVLDVMVAALTDTIGDHPELLQGREMNPSMIPGNRMMRPITESSSPSAASAARAVLAAYRDELLRGSRGFMPGRN